MRRNKHVAWLSATLARRASEGNRRTGPRLRVGLVFGETWALVGSLLLLVFAVGCGTSQVDRSTGSRLPTFAGIPPLAFLVDQIGGTHVKVQSLVQAGQDPHTFEPTPQQVYALGNAAIFFKIDMPFENVLLQKVQEGNPRLMVVDTTHGIKKRAMDAAYGETLPSTIGRGAGGEGHDHESEAGQPDPHVWLSPPLVKIQAENIAAALCKADPAHKREYERNLTTLTERLDALHRRLQKRLAPYQGRSFYVFHPGFGYFADAYGLKQEAVEAGGRSPTPKQLRALIEKAQADGVKTVFIQPQSAPQSAQVIADALGGKVVVINGLGSNVIEDIEDIAAKVEAAMRGEGEEKREAGSHGGKASAFSPLPSPLSSLSFSAEL